MPDTVNIDKNSRQAYFPKDLIEKGFFGKCPLITNDGVVVIFNPKISIESQIKSLEAVLPILKVRKVINGEEIKEAA